MLHKSYEFKFCPVCGGALVSKSFRQKEPPRLACTRCEFIFYLDPKVVACSIVEFDHRIILLRRATEPQRSKWVIPGGYVDRFEPVNAAAVRETMEECGIRTRIKDLVGVYSYAERLPVVVVYEAEYLSGELTVGDESEEAMLFLPDEIPWEDLAFQSTKDALRDYSGTRNSERGSRNMEGRVPRAR